MIDGTYTVGQAADLVGASKNTIRLYGRDFEQFLSDGATPESGMQRSFTDDDIKVMITIKTLRAQRIPKEGLVKALLDGERYEPDETPLEVDEAASGTPEAKGLKESRALATTELLERFVVRYEARIDGLEGQLEAAQNQVTTERDARLSAEVDAARAAGQLEAIYRRHWWQVWRPEKPEE